MFKKKIEESLAKEIISPGSRKETLNAIFMPKAPESVIKFYNFMQDHITFVENGFGVALRENRADLKKLMESQGYDYIIYKTFIDEFERLLLKQHYDE